MLTKARFNLAQRNKLLQSLASYVAAKNSKSCHVMLRTLIFHYVAVVGALVPTCWLRSNVKTLDPGVALYVIFLSFPYLCHEILRFDAVFTVFIVFLLCFYLSFHWFLCLFTCHIMLLHINADVPRCIWACRWIFVNYMCELIFTLFHTFETHVKMSNSWYSFHTLRCPGIT
jgi:hypothetical protein